jgi:hypothetical protein
MKRQIFLLIWLLAKDMIRPSLIRFLFFYNLVFTFLSCSTSPAKQKIDLSNYQLSNNQLFLERSKDDNLKEFVGVPLTECYVALNTVQSENGFWHRDFLVPSPWSTLYIEMDPPKVPDGPWRDYTGGLFQMMILLKNKDLSDIDINFDSPSDITYFLLNNYHGPDRKDKVLGNLHLFKKDSAFVADGLITIITEENLAVQVIRFSSSKIPFYDSTGIKTHFSQAERKHQDKEEMISRLFDTVSTIERRFYERIAKGYPTNNHLLAEAAFAEKQFNCDLSHSLIVSGVSTSASDIRKLNSGNLYAFRIPFRYDPIPMADDDETSIFVSIALKTLTPHVKQNAKKDFSCELNTNGWGGNAYSPKVTDYDGEIVINEITEGLARGSLKITFKQEGDSFFTIKGNFAVRVIDFQEWQSFDLEREKIYEKIDRIEKNGS